MYITIRTDTGWRGEYENAELEHEDGELVVRQGKKELLRVPRSSVVYYSAEKEPSA